MKEAKLFKQDAAIQAILYVLQKMGDSDEYIRYIEEQLRAEEASFSPSSMVLTIASSSW